VNILAQASADSINFGPIIAAIITSAAATFAVIATSKLTWHRDAKKSLKDYAQVVKAVRHELAFYLEKLAAAKRDLKALIEAVESGAGQKIVPAYRFYPSYLEQLKLELAKKSSEDALVQAVGGCHFELSFIAERLERLQMLATQPSPLVGGVSGGPGSAEHLAGIMMRSEKRANVLNEAKAVLGLVDLNIPAFEAGILLCDKEVETKEAALSKYEVDHPFSPW
jgi:hypothetical protein